MASYPSAALLYGISLGPQEDPEWPWCTEELEEEHGGPAEVLDHLLKGIPKVGHYTYGNFNSGYACFALCTQSLTARAYAPQPVGIDRLTATADDDVALRAAWAVLHPDRLMPEPGWFIVVSYG